MIKIEIEDTNISDDRIQECAEILAKNILKEFLSEFKGTKRKRITQVIFPTSVEWAATNGNDYRKVIYTAEILYVDTALYKSDYKKYSYIQHTSVTVIYDDSQYPLFKKPNIQNPQSGFAVYYQDSPDVSNEKTQAFYKAVIEKFLNSVKPLTDSHWNNWKFIQLPILSTFTPEFHYFSFQNKSPGYLAFNLIEPIEIESILKHNVVTRVFDDSELTYFTLCLNFLYKFKSESFMIQRLSFVFHTKDNVIKSLRLLADLFDSDKLRIELAMTESKILMA